METTLLKKEDIWGDNALQVIKDYGTETGVTDLGIILGGLMGSGRKTSEGDTAGYIWSASSDGDDSVLIVTKYGDRSETYTHTREAAARPALPSSVTSSIHPSSVRTVNLKNGETVQIGTFGEYPQAIVSDSIAKDLEIAHKQGRLRKSGKKYTFDSERRDVYEEDFKPRVCEEYELSGKKYIRVEGKPANGYSVLSNGHKVEQGKAYWVEVQPIEWLIDPKGMWVAKKALFSGIRFNGGADSGGNFAKTEMKSYLDKYFSNEMQPSRTATRTQEAEKNEPSKRRVGHGVQVIEEPMSVKDQIDFYIKNGMSFMLHGPSGVGKTARVEQVAPT